jgi:oxalate decarboxylase/phosphoglucose isomerase-like protein (cupin superfamily)
MKKTIIPIYTIILVTSIISCNSANNTSQATNDIATIFKNGDLMTNISTDPNGNALVYPSGDASITSQVKVWEPGFNSPWHYHPYQCVAHIIQGELTVNFDTIASIDDKSPNKSTSITKFFKAGEAFIGTANTWHYSQNLGSEDLIFTTSWLAEKDGPIAVLADKE